MQGSHKRLTVRARSRVALEPTIVPSPSATPPWETVVDRATLPLEGLECLFDSALIRPGADLVARLLGADASHAWLAVYCPNAGWIHVDPTNNVLPSCSHITIAWGRDYDDVSPVHGVILGGGSHTLRVNVDVLRVAQSSADGGALLDHADIDVHAEERRDRTDEGAP